MAPVSNLLHRECLRPGLRCVSVCQGAHNQHPVIKEKAIPVNRGVALPPFRSTVSLSAAERRVIFQPQRSYVVGSRNYAIHTRFSDRTVHLQRLKISLPKYVSAFFSSFSSGETDNVKQVSDLSGLNKSDHDILNTHMVKKLMEIARSHNSPGAILNAAEAANNDGLLQLEDLSSIFSSYKTAVYDTVKYPWLFPEVELKREQLRMSFLDRRLLEPYTSDAQFQNLISLTEEHVLDLPLADCPQILHCFNFLLIPNDNSLVDKLNKRCLENIFLLDFHQLALLAACQCQSPRDFVAYGQITEAAKNLLIHLPSQEIDLKDLCDIFVHMKHFISQEMISLGVRVIMSCLEQDPSNVDLSMFSSISLFDEITGKECTEILSNKMLGFPNNYFQNIDTDKCHLTFVSCSAIGKNPLLCPVYETVKQQCLSLLSLSALSNSDTIAIKDQVKLSLALDKIPVEVRKILTQCVKNSDNFLFFQLMDHHLRVDLPHLRDGRTMMYALHRRLVKLVTELDETQLQDLLWAKNGEVAKNIFKMMRRMQAAGIDVDEDLTELLDKQVCFKSLHCDSPKAKISQSVLRAIDLLKSNIALAHPDLSTLMRSMNRLDFDDIVDHYARVDALLLSGCLSSVVKRQGFQLGEKLSNIFDDQLSRVHTIVPPVSSKCIWQSSKRRSSWHVERRGLSDRLVNNFPRFTVTGEEKNCARILHALDVAFSKGFVVLQEDTFEDLIKFVTSQPEVQIYSGIQLLKVLSQSGYQPKDYEGFYQWILQLALAVMERASLSKMQQVQMAYHLSLFGILLDEMLCDIFSLDFIMDLEKEWKDSGAKEKKELALLNRSVVVECPHLAVPWFGQKLFPKNTGNGQVLSLERMVDSVARVCGGSQYVLAHSESPYGHHIDALINFDSNMTLVKQDNTQSSTDRSADFERLALLYLDHNHFCYNSDKLTGTRQADIRQLQMLGYFVSVIPHYELSSMELHNEQSLDNYVRTKINRAMPFEVFMDPTLTQA